MFKFILILALTCNVAFAGAGQLVDFLFSKSAVEDILKKNGIVGEDSKRVAKYISNSLDALNIKTKTNFTKEDLKDALKNLPTSGETSKIKNELRVLLDKPENEIKKEDIVKAIDSLVYLANKYPRAGSFIISCVGCAGDPLALHGFKYTLSEISNTNSKKALETLIPKDSAELKKYISNKMKVIGGTYSTPVPAEEEKALALFLTLVKEGDKNQKSLANAVLEFSKQNGKLSLTDNKLYTLFANDMSPESMQGWTDMLTQVSKDAKSGSKKDAFYSYLEKKAGNNKSLQNNVKKLKEKNCFFP